LTSCEWCTSWTDEFRKDIAVEAVTEIWGKNICVECGKHLMTVTSQALENKLHEIKDNLGDKVTIFKGRNGNYTEIK
jgi:hypothetical protein